MKNLKGSLISVPVVGVDPGMGRRIGLIQTQADFRISERFQFRSDFSQPLGGTSGNIHESFPQSGQVHSGTTDQNRASPTRLDFGIGLLEFAAERDGVKFFSRGNEIDQMMRISLTQFYVRTSSRHSISCIRIIRHFTLTVKSRHFCT